MPCTHWQDVVFGHSERVGTTLVVGMDLKRYKMHTKPKDHVDPTHFSTILLAQSPVPRSMCSPGQWASTKAPVSCRCLSPIQSSV
jgi:hypothetical protein